MPWLKFYAEERKRFPEAFQRKVADKHVQLIVNKLVRHFKISNHTVGVDFYGNRAGHAYYRYLTLPHNPSFGLICHELAHILHMRKHGKSRHNKKLMQIIKRLVNYCKKKGYWQAEIQRRNKPKPKPTKLHVLQKKLAKEQKAVKRISTRIKRLKTYLKKHQKRERYYQKQIKKQNDGIKNVEQN